MIKYKHIDVKKDANVFFSSDFHGYHKNICKGLSEWGERETRDFTDEIEMTDLLVSNINKTVKQDDVLFFLGDWTFGGQDKIELLRSRINCKKIYLTFGNHDHGIINSPEKQALFEKCSDVMYIEVRGVKFFLSHYAHYVWHQSHHGVTHLYGHSHSSLEHITQGKMMDVGIDNAFKLLKEYRPFKLEEVLEIMKTKEINFCDHHSEVTN